VKGKTLIWLGFASGFVVALISVFMISRGSTTSSASSTNLVVLCTSCSLKGLPQQGHLILLDASTGDIWIYSDQAMEGTTKPIHWGKLTLGQPVTRFKENQ
jgi:hypothetical protein